MGSDLTHVIATYGFCSAIVMLYASARFNTPVTNRSSTVQLWYWQGLLAYIISCITLFGVLSVVLEQPALRKLLLDFPLAESTVSGAAAPLSSKQTETIMAIPPALAAMLVMTALMPSVPYVKTLDRAMLAFFLRMACIPAEVTRRSKILNHSNLRLLSSDLKEIESFIHDTPIPNEATGFLRTSEETAWENSELRFTKVLLAFRRLDALQELPRYSKFFDENAMEYDNFRKTMIEFASRAVKGLTVAKRLRIQAAQSEYEELISERRETFKLECIERFAAVSLLLARAILQCEMSERDVRKRLHSIGFEEVAIQRPYIPIHQLTALCVGILVYLLLIGVVLHPPTSDPRTAAFKWVPFLISMAHVLTIGITIWIMQTVPWARRAMDGARPVASYLFCGLLGTILTIALCVLWDLAQIGTFPTGERFRFLFPFAILCGLLCVFVAFACDDRPPSIPEPLWFRGVEALGCGLAMGFVSWLIMQFFPIPLDTPQLPNPWIGAVLPAGTGLVVGFFIPEIYREGLRRAATEDLTSALDFSDQAKATSPFDGRKSTIDSGCS
jgi:hypothetical protein